MLDTAF
jgi:hypothetical protein